MWENLVGRSLPFWRHFFPRLQETFPDALAGVDVESWYRAVNAVQPSLIRVEADEATYNLHIILRFELEQDMLAASSSSSSCRRPGTAACGSTSGSRCRTTGRRPAGRPLVGRRDRLLPDLRARQRRSPRRSGSRSWRTSPTCTTQFEHGDFAQLRDWLRSNLHATGASSRPREMLERVVGAGLDPEPYLRYLREKLGGIYGIAAVAPLVRVAGMAKTRVGINGFGRIGRNFFRAAHERGARLRDRRVQRPRRRADDGAPPQARLGARPVRRRREVEGGSLDGRRQGAEGPRRARPGAAAVGRPRRRRRDRVDRLLHRSRTARRSTSTRARRRSSSPRRPPTPTSRSCSA